MFCRKGRNLNLRIEKTINETNHSSGMCDVFYQVILVKPEIDLSTDIFKLLKFFIYIFRNFKMYIIRKSNIELSNGIATKQIVLNEIFKDKNILKYFLSDQI